MVEQRASKKQQELLSFVDGFIKGNGYGPSYREIMRALGYKSVSTVAIHIDGLIAKGYLARRDKSARSLEVVTRSLTDAVKPAQPAATNHSTEDELQKAVTKAQLTDDERRQAAELFKRLGFTQLSDRLKAHDETTE